MITKTTTKSEIEHKTVMLSETVDRLMIEDNDIVVDMTLGGGGHSEAILKSGAKNLTLIGIDADHEAIERASRRLFQDGVFSKKNQNHKIIFENEYFDSIEEILKKNEIKKVNRVVFDLGYSSFEIDSSERGFSFQNDGPLKMTYSQNPSEKQLTAYDVVNLFEEENLADIIYGFGEEKFSRRIAKAIIAKREIKPIETTFELAEIINESVPRFYRQFKAGGSSKTHPATKTFQAIRIAVNSELERLKIALNDSFKYLESEGRIAVITFHSLEDRIVKNFFRQKVKDSEANFINKKPIIPDRFEINENPRSRSAKLRIIQKI